MLAIFRYITRFFGFLIYNIHQKIVLVLPRKCLKVARNLSAKSGARKYFILKTLSKDRLN